MKASEALLLGSLSTEQSFYPGYGTELCALETIAHALGLPCSAREYDFYSQLLNVYPWMGGYRSPCPVCKTIGAVISVTWHLNDMHKMPRPQIAEWLKQYEPVEEESTVAPLLETATVAV